MEFKNIDVAKKDTNVAFGASAPVLPDGFYCVKLISETEEKQTSRGTMRGQNFSFEVKKPEKFSGQKVNLWFATSVSESRDNWLIEQTESFFSRIAKVLGIKKLSDTSQLYDQSFWIYFVAQKQTRKEQKLNKDTGEIETKDVESISNRFVGNLNERILSVEEYFDKFSDKKTTEKKFVKKQEVEAEKEVELKNDDDKIPF